MLRNTGKLREKKNKLECFKGGFVTSGLTSGESLIMTHTDRGHTAGTFFRTNKYCLRVQ